MKLRISESDHRMVSDAVGRAERDTDGEIVTIIAARSDHYADVILAIALFVAVLCLIALTAAPQALSDAFHAISGRWRETSEAALGVWPGIAAAALVFLLVALLLTLTPLGDRLLPRGVRTRRVADRALDYFRVAAQKRTVGLTGVLIYLSVAEHRAEIIADEAIASKVDADTWGEAMTALLEEVKEGRPAVGMVAAVERVGVVLREHFPKSDGNRNELPDRLIEL